MFRALAASSLRKIVQRRLFATPPSQNPGQKPLEGFEKLMQKVSGVSWRGSMQSIPPKSVDVSDALAKFRQNRHNPSSQGTQKQQTSAATQDSTPKPNYAVMRHSQGVERTVNIGDTIPLRELATASGARVVDVLKALIVLGEGPKSASVTLQGDSAELAVEEMLLRKWISNVKINRVRPRAIDVQRQYTRERIAKEVSAGEKYPPKPAVATILGHVDHGKTTLLDALRQTAVAAKEAGGITQSIGAFSVTRDDGDKLTFLDTPGHAAFTNMRKRGAAVTDVAVLVVAADDGIMPQTIEAIRHIQDSNVPMVVAINKCDKEGADPDKIVAALEEYGVQTEDKGGDVQVVRISALAALNKKGEGNLQALIDSIHLQADLSGICMAPEDVPAEGVVIESRIDKQVGPVASVIVTAGTMKAGDAFVCGCSYGKAKHFAINGQRVTSAGPATPIDLMGLKETPAAGDDFIVVESEEKARRIAEWRRELRESANEMRKKRAAARAASRVGVIDLPVILKADVHGSMEAIVEALETAHQPSKEVAVRIVAAGVGNVHESDIALAEASKSMIIGFNVRTGALINQSARLHNVTVKNYKVIYSLISDIRGQLTSLLPSVEEVVIKGRAEVAQLFPIKGKKAEGTSSVAGSRVIEGTFFKNLPVRLVRDGEIVWNGKVASLRHFKEEVPEMEKGKECGILLAECPDIQQGDIIQCIETVKRQRTLEE